MKNPLIVCLVSLLCVGTSLAESRTFTNKEGKTLAADVIAVEDKVVVLKLANASKVKVPLSSLSEADQEFIKSWREENKNKVTEMDVRLEIDKNTKRIKPDSDDSKGKGKKKKESKEEVQFSCVLKSFTHRDISDITAAYTIYKRVSTRGEDGSNTTTEETNGDAKVASLVSNESVTFETVVVTCEDSSSKGGKGPSSSKRETVIGIVVALSANGEEFMKQGYPDNFLDRLQEEEERQAREKDN